MTFAELLIIASLGFIAPSKILGPPIDTKASGPPLIYLVRPLAISDPHINVCVGALTLAFIVGKGEWGSYPSPFLNPPPFLEIQDVPTFYRNFGRTFTKVVKCKFDTMLYTF